MFTHRPYVQNGFSFMIILFLVAGITVLGIGVHQQKKAPVEVEKLVQSQTSEKQTPLGIPTTTIESVVAQTKQQLESEVRPLEKKSTTIQKTTTNTTKALTITSGNFQQLIGEITILSKAGNLIGSEHYTRLQDALDRAAKTGMESIEVQKLQKMLDALKIPQSHPAGNYQKSSPTLPQQTTETYRANNQAVFRSDPEIPHAGEIAQIPVCGNQQFLTSPVDLSKVFSVTPRGNLGPPGHTFPTEHMFFHVSAGGASTETIPLLSPADVYITLISFGHGMTQDPVDYTIWFALCRDVIGYYNHVKSLSPELEKIVAEKECRFSGESKQTRCNIETLTPIKNAVPLGAVGRLQGNFDFGIFDLRKKLLFANPARYGTRSLYIQCAFDYYEPSLKSRLYALLDRADHSCGEVAQDKPGTLQGNWFAGNAQGNSGTDWNKYLAFVKDNKNPETSVISIGGTFTDVGKWEFKATASGTINREFKDVTPDSVTYCYEATGKSGRILLAMPTTQTLKIEHQQNTCAAQFEFISPTLYSR
ncbi:MAG: hypothetical protein Greene041614_264 [Parcubacteria group bacterium Greene0416_14]|nr:MAG: hypothetical protein Greene041614_264 [Parcubacteria group bacterium Greene0416_14]TSC99868.1 MAG: hypothetical protein Greene101415_1056 [Parcubacteria group bacterium Greene1014_15]TSD06687.1 MAG: hypothetical protein Greene07144_1127 [Parcubacteria group bacterium Greene0714_4]